MAAYQSLDQELECPICLEYQKNPKVMGKCLHAACLECLEKLVAARNTDFFPCPVCREKCTIPPKGVGDLKDDFRLRAIVEKFQKIKVDKTLIPCTACPNPASHFCKECDKIFLCRSCSRKHSLDPFTSAHKLVGICSKHGKKLIMYCRKCGTTICSACRIVNHPSDSLEHDVIQLQTVAAEETTEVVAALDRLDRTCKQKEEELGNIIATRDRAVARMDSDLIELGTQSDAAIEHTHTKHCELKEKSSSIQQQIEAWKKQKTVVDEEIAQTGKKESSLRLEKQLFTKYLHFSRDQCMKEFKEAVEQLAAENDGMKALADLGRNETTLERVLDGQTIPSLLQLKEEVTKAIDEAEDRVDTISLKVEERLVGFVPNSAPMEIGFLKRGSTKVSRNEISNVVHVTVNKFADVSYPANRPCQSLYSIRYLPDGRLASLYQSWSNSDQLADTITLHDPASPAVPLSVIDQKIQPGSDMAVTAKGELMVLRLEAELNEQRHNPVKMVMMKTERMGRMTEKKMRPELAPPSVRVFRNDGGGVRDIDLRFGHLSDRPRVYYNPSRSRDRDVRLIEADKKGNMFVVNNDGGHLCVFAQDGRLKQAKQHKCGFGQCLGMSYHMPTRILYIANGRNIVMCHWNGTTYKLKEISSDAHGVDGFLCTDVCINDGQVFAAGVMATTREIRIYQVVEADQPIQGEPAASSTSDDEELYASGPSVRKDDVRFEWIRLNFGDGANRTMPDDWQPIAWITVFGNTLALGYHNKVELFHLNP